MNLIPEDKVEIVPSPFLRSSRSSCLQWSSSRRIAASPATRGKLRDAGGPYRRSQWKKKVEFRSRQPRRTVALGHSRRVGSACGPCGHEFLEARSRWARKRRSANDILPADPGEMSKYLARFDLTEH